MDTKKLRQKILDLAIRGKLVPQDPNDEPASVLLERIRAEKKQLIKEGKIKKSKVTPTDKSHYEKIEGPFEIPESWEWSTLGEIGKWQAGGTPSRRNRDYYGGSIPWLKTGDLNDGIITDIPESITQEALDNSSAKLNPAGSILIAMYGATIGKLGILSFPATTNQACCACIEYPSVEQMYLFYYLLSHKEEFIRRGGGGAQPNISKEIIVKTFIPIPPKSEQTRIIRKIQRCFLLLDHIENNSMLLTNSITTLKSRVLEMAISGKLVPQDPSDEPAIELLRRINPDFKPCDNSHYENVPTGWALLKVADVFEINPKIQASDDVDAGFVPMTNICEGFRNEFSFEVRKWGMIKSGFSRFADGDIAVAKISPCLENRKSVVVHDLPNGIGAGTTELNIFRSKVINPEYSLLFFKSDSFIDKCSGSYNGVVGQQRVSRSLIEEMTFKVPPVAEQKRIVATVKEYFDVINEIETSL